jgi:DNA-binding NarL/FixJ family response regulator
VVASLVSARSDDDPLAEVTEREREVLELMAEGLTNVGIAKRLYLSERTVEAHVRHVLMKLDLPESDDGHRRVLAVLAHLSATQESVT